MDTDTPRSSQQLTERCGAMLETTGVPLLGQCDDIQDTEEGEGTSVGDGVQVHISIVVTFLGYHPRTLSFKKLTDISSTWQS